jgi:hypothetical protein
MPLIEPMVEDDSILGDEDVKIKEFLSEDGKFKINYYSNCIKDGDRAETDILDGKYRLNTLFSCQTAEQGNIIQLDVKNGTTSASFEEIIADMKTDSKDRGWTMEILNSDEESKIFEATYSKDDRHTLHSEERIMYPTDDKVIFVAFVGFDSKWEDLEDQADEIIISAEITD